MQNKPRKKPVAARTQKAKAAGRPASGEAFLRTFIPLLFILPVVFAAFSPILDNELTNWDDPALITENPLIRDFSVEGVGKIFSSFYFGNYQPLHLLSYMIEYHFWQLNPAGYHAVSLVLFLLVTTLVYFFINRLTNGNKTIAILGALLFSVNAMRVESVAWAAERKDMLYALFYMASLIAYVKYITSGNNPGTNLKMRFFIYAFLFFLLSVFSKVMAVSIVGPMVFLDYYYSRKISLRLILEKIPFVAVSIVIGLLQIRAVASAGTIDESEMFTLGDRLLIVCRNLMFSFYKILAPVNLSVFNPYPVRTPGTLWPMEFYIAPFFVLGLLILAVWSYRKTKIVIFCLGFFLASIALVLQFVAIGPTLFNERYSLMPSVALSFGLAYAIWWIVKRYPRSKYFMFGAAGLYLVVMFVLTYQRCNVWQNSLSIWDNALEQFPHASMPLNNRGKIYGKDLGNTTRAMQDLTLAIRYGPNNEQAYSNRGIIYCMNGKFDSAIADFNNAIRINPDYYEALVNRGIAYAQTNRPALALEDFNKCLALEPAKPEGYMNRGFCYLQLKQYDKALEDFNTGLKIDPSQSQFYIRRSQTLYNLKRYGEAFSDVQAARSMGVPVEDSYFNLVKKAAGSDYDSLK